MSKPWFIIGISLLSCFTVAAQKEAPQIRNIVLVHGAWADGSGWKGVYDILVKDGYKVSIVQEPETSFKEDVAATKRMIAQQDGPCVVVAHSYGGAVITEATNDPKVVALVYVAAHMPDAGESEAEDGKRFPSDLSKSTAIKKTTDGFTYLDPAQFHEYFAADLPLRKPLSWHDRRCSTTPTISMQLSRRRRGEANRAGCWYPQRIEPSIPILNGGTPREQKVTRWKFQARATPFTFPDRRRLRLS